MPPPVLTRQERADQLWLQRDLHDNLVTASKFFADEDTRRMFKAFHKGLAGLSMQTNITSSERLSSVSPHLVDPWRRLTWIPVDVVRDDEFVSTPYTFASKVYRLVGIKRSPVVRGLDGVVVSDWLEENEHYTWDADTSTITFSDARLSAAITGTANNGSGLVRCTAAAHGLTTGDVIAVAGLTDVEDGEITVTVVDANTFDIQGSSFATAEDTGMLEYREKYVTGYAQTAVLDEQGNPRYHYTPVWGEVQIVGKAGIPLVDANGDPITQPVILSYEQGDPITADDMSNPVYATRPLYVLAEGRYWVVEAVQESTYMWNVTAASIGFTQSLRPLGFTPAHVPYVLQAIEEALQSGFSSGPFTRALSALAGNPFAYGDGRIVDYELGGDVHYAVIEDYDNELVYYCEVPQACNLKVAILKPVGSLVTKFEPLLLESPTTIQFDDQHQDAVWGAPVAVHMLSNEEIGVGQMQFGSDAPWDEELSDPRDLFVLGIGTEYAALRTWDTAVNPGTGGSLTWGDSAVLFDEDEVDTLSSGHPILIRNPWQGWSQVYSARRAEGARLYLDGYLPDLRPGEVLFAQALVQDAASATQSAIKVWAPALQASEKPLRWLIDRIVPTSIAVSLRLLQQVWDRLYCPWNQQTGAWHAAIPGPHWESAAGVYWNLNQYTWSGD